ncbi:Hypothetical protein SMAX5B_021567 [Scophthalmus maximus]|uniref:Uncharacterized protein n=1 Tax=Scophthalmus maximus TaxID=52904 RepID=A0A2U9BM01_SCOMX|nr:Hypothetical protein SMAX5B_021567 [Scophthalmus maximus]
MFTLNQRQNQDTFKLGRTSPVQTRTQRVNRDQVTLLHLSWALVKDRPLSGQPLRTSRKEEQLTLHRDQT